MNADSVTREDVLHTLANMGYPEVSMEMIDEFLNEIRQEQQSMKPAQTEKKEEKQPKFAPLPPNNKKIEQPKEYETDDYYNGETDEEEEDEDEDDGAEDALSGTDNELSSDSEDEQDDLEDGTPNFALPLQHPAKSSPTKKPQESASNHLGFKLSQFSPPRLETKQKTKSPRITVAVSPSKPQTPKQVERPKSAITRSPSSQEKSHLPQPSSSSPRPGTASGRSTPRSSSTRSSASSFSFRPKPVDYRKRVHDPVARFQQMQNVWKKDKFLTDTTKQRKDLRTQVRREMSAIRGESVY